VSKNIKTSICERIVEDLFVEVDGKSVHYQRAGTGRPLLLIHGLVGSALNWRENIDVLSECATVYAIDLLNMGQSDRIPDLDAGLEATADSIAAWMQAVGLKQMDIVGHSHGGAVAMMLAARHPERVGKLILFAPANPFCDLGRTLIAFYNTRPGVFVANLIPWLPSVVKSTALRRMYGDPTRVKPQALEGYTAGLSKPGSVQHVLQIVRRWHEDMASLRSVLANLADHPTLLIWGDRDRAVGLSSAERLREILPHAELIVIPGAGHIAFEEMPEVCNQIVSDWLATQQTPEPRPGAFQMRYPSEPLHQLRAV